MDQKTRFCKHPNGCIHDTLKQLLKQAKYSIIISSILQLLKSLKMLFKGFSNFKKSFTPSYFSIILFMGASTAVLRLVKCGLRRIRGKDDALNSILAGVAAGFVGTKTLKKQFWYVLLMFIASRIVGAIHQSLIQSGYLQQTRKQLHYFVLFFLTNIVHCYGYFIQPDILKPDIYNLYERMSVLTPNQKRWHVSSLVYKKTQLEKQGVKFFTNYTQQKINQLRIKISQNN